jgi:hypothetical protein
MNSMWVRPLAGRLSFNLVVAPPLARLVPNIFRWSNDFSRRNPIALRTAASLRLRPQNPCPRCQEVCCRDYNYPLP